jgi:iron only hydrogenase large subunit-like protein
MNARDPVYTEKVECRDCYKCVRSCVVKAIGVVNDHATVVPERCIACGLCVEACPAGAKRVRNDLGKAKALLATGRPLYASLAPSFVSEFPRITPAALVHGLRRLGFAGVSETALGAEEVSAEVAARLRTEVPEVLVSSACPAVVELLAKYLPAFAGHITGLTSPVMAHCRLLRATYGDDIAIVFISPCIAKKKEADAHPELLDAAITFEDLRTWLAEADVPLENVHPGPDDILVPRLAADGAMYPVDGGMIASIQASGASAAAADYVALSGLETIRRALEGLDTAILDRPLFLELLACEGGCVNGPKSSSQRGTVLKRQAVLNQDRPPPIAAGRRPRVDTSMPVVSVPLDSRPPADERLREALREVGKHSAVDELNCGGCGYENCRAFAAALVAGLAERGMCVSYMRKLAHNKATLLMQTMPSGVVVVNDKMEIVECNANFATMLGQEAREIFAARPGMEGALLDRLAPFHQVFARLLASGEPLLEKDVRTEHGVFELTVFTLEPHRLVGGVMRDVTQPVVQKERIVSKTREVMVKNLNTVQQIARLLGENAAESETILASIINSFETPHLHDGQPGGTKDQASARQAKA